MKNTEEDQLDTIRVNDSRDALRTLENCVRLGRAVLLEDAGETLDSALVPVLLKQLVRQGAGGGGSVKIGDTLTITLTLTLTLTRPWVGGARTRRGRELYAVVSNIRSPNPNPNPNPGDALVPWHDDFRFYTTSKLSNPHLAPEVCLCASVKLLSVGVRVRLGCGCLGC